MVGRHDANEKLPYGRGTLVDGDPFTFYSCRPVHLAIAPPRRSRGDPRPPPDAVTLLVRELWVDVNAQDLFGRTPLHWVAFAAPGHQGPALSALLALGGDLERRASDGGTPLAAAAERVPRRLVPLLLSRGASANTFDAEFFTPLMNACIEARQPARDAIIALLRASTPETRHAVSRYGQSAADFLVSLSLSLARPAHKSLITGSLETAPDRGMARVGRACGGRHCYRRACPSNPTTRPARCPLPPASPSAAQPRRPLPRASTTPRPGRCAKRWWAWRSTFRLMRR
jgi:hypothetical protein